MARTNEIQETDIPLSVILDVCQGDAEHLVAPGHLFWMLQKAAFRAAKQKGMTHLLHLEYTMFRPKYTLGEVATVNGFRLRELVVVEVEIINHATGQIESVTLDEPFIEEMFAMTRPIEQAA